MAALFGPQLLGETEKTLAALLRQSLADTGLDEQLWVTLRVASQHEGPMGTLAAAVADRAHFTAPHALVEELTRRGLLADERPTPPADELLRSVLSRVSEIWQDVPDADAAARALSTVLGRARRVLATQQ